MRVFKLVRNHLALFFLAALAVSGVAYLVWAVGANVNCIAGTCSSTNGNQDSATPYDSTTVFTGENDTASIECAGGIYQLGGGNDVAYLANPQAVPVAVNTVNGEDGDDVIVDGCTSGNALVGGNGNDFIAEDAVGILVGGNGNDLLAGGQDNDVFGDTNLSGACDAGESDPNNDVWVGGPGNDTYCTAANDGDDIVIIHRGDVPAGGTESYTCQGNDTILLFGFDRDGVVEVPPTTSPYTVTDPVTGGTYSFSATSPNKCTIIFVE